MTEIKPVHEHTRLLNPSTLLDFFVGGEGNVFILSRILTDIGTEMTVVNLVMGYRNFSTIFSNCNEIITLHRLCILRRIKMYAFSVLSSTGRISNYFSIISTIKTI